MSRNLLDSAVQESYLAVPYAFAKLGRPRRSAEYYEQAVRSFDEERTQSDEAIARIRERPDAGRLLAKEADGARYGWFWQLKQELPDAPESRYLYAVMAGNDFQEGLKNYRDMSYLDATLTRWNDNIEVFGDMIATRDRAFAELIPQAEELLAAQPVAPLTARRDGMRDRLEQAQRAGDVPVLGTTEQRAQWRRVQAVEQALAALPDDEATAEPRAKLRLVKGVLYWRMNQDFRARVLGSRKALVEADAALAESKDRFGRLASCATRSGATAAEFSERLAALQQRLTVLHARLDDSRKQQSGYARRTGRGRTDHATAASPHYELQARFALATIYDKASTPKAVAKKASADGEPTSDDAVPGAAAPDRRRLKPAERHHDARPLVSYFAGGAGLHCERKRYGAAAHIGRN